VGISFPYVNRNSYSAEMRVNMRQLDNMARVVDNALILVGGIIIFRQVIPASLPIIVAP